MTRNVEQSNIERYNLTDVTQLFGYQATDWEIADYRQYRFDNKKICFRGPSYAGLFEDKSKSRTAAFLGAAQFLGRFCTQSLPDIIAAETDWKCLNFGFGGASPRLFLSLGESFFDVVNRCDLAVVQILSARAAPNAWLRVKHPHNPNMVSIGDSTEEIFINEAWKRLLDTLTARQFEQAIQQTQLNYCRQMEELLGNIKTRKLLMWYSERGTSYQPSFGHWSKVLGGFPQMVQTHMIERLKPHADDYLEVVSTAGRPHMLVSRFDGSPVRMYDNRPEPSENYYYPTPQMHVDASRALKPYLGTLAK
jgi:hypothetical protein